MIEILTLQEYQSVKRAWIEPLNMPELFIIRDRIEIIKSLFPKASPENDSKFYRWVWEINTHWCVNCGLPLKEYWAGYISHIYTRGAHTEYRYDPLNTNILCNDCHQKWETGLEIEKIMMYVYWLNKSRVKHFLRE
jgi:hypothetical protein